MNASITSARVSLVIFPSLFGLPKSVIVGLTSKLSKPTLNEPYLNLVNMQRESHLQYPVENKVADAPDSGGIFDGSCALVDRKHLSVERDSVPSSMSLRQRIPFSSNGADSPRILDEQGLACSSVYRSPCR